MLKLIIKRILEGILSAFFAMTVVFIFMRILPGDPALYILGEHASSEALEIIRVQLGLNKPLMSQYLTFFSEVLNGHLGYSLISNKPVNELILNVLPYSIELVIASTVIGIMIGIPLGVISALKRNSFIDYCVRILSLVGLSFPVFFLGAVFLILFSYNLKLFPVVGISEVREGISITDRLHRLFLPSFTLGLVGAAYIMRVTRTSLLNALNERYIITARSKGLKERSVIIKHALRNSLISVATVIGLQMSVTIGGSILVEIVFSRPGLGRLLVGAINGRDYPIMQSGLLILSLLVVLFNLLVNISYGLIEPRIKHE